MKTILVPTDFSENADKALEYALGFARHNGSEIIFFHAWDLPPNNTTMFLTIKNLIKGKAELDMKNLVDKVKANPKYCNLKTESILMMGDAASLIKRLARHRAVDIIIMGTRGAGGIKKIFLGSNTAEVIESATCPVLAIPETCSFNLVQKILYATEFKKDGLQALNQLFPIAKFFDAEIIVAHVSSSVSPGEAEFRKFAKDVKDKFIYPKLRFKYFNNDDVIDGLNQLVKAENIQLIAMLAHKKGYFEKVFTRSYTKEMAYAATAPLLVFPDSKENVDIPALKGQN